MRILFFERTHGTMAL